MRACGVKNKFKPSVHDREMSRLVDYLFPAASALGLPVLILVSPQVGRPVFVVAPPWLGSARTVDLVGRADGFVVRGTGASWIAVAVSERPDFATRLREAGAWLIVDAAMMAGCAGATEPRSRTPDR